MPKWKKVNLDEFFTSGLGEDDDPAFCCEIEELSEEPLEVPRKLSKGEKNPEDKTVLASNKFSKATKTKRKVSTAESADHKISASEKSEPLKKKRKKKDISTSAAVDEKVKGKKIKEKKLISKSKDPVSSNIYQNVKCETDGEMFDGSLKLSTQKLNELKATIRKAPTKNKTKKKKTLDTIAPARVDWSLLKSTMNSNDVKQELDANEDITETNRVWTEICGVPREVMVNISKLNYKEPTAIQRKVLPIAVDGKVDLIAAAETGSGKTLAFVVPAIKRILEFRKLKSTERNPLVLMLLPTRELAVQVSEHVKALTLNIDPKITYVTIVGGLSVQKQHRILKRSHPEIVIATPGRLNQLLVANESEHLRKIGMVRCLVLDEADRLCESGHFKELESVLNYVYRTSSEENEQGTTVRQTLVLSATLTVANQTRSTQGTEVKLAAIAPIFSKVQFKNPLKIVDITRDDVTAENLKEFKLLCPLEEKDLYLYYCLNTLSEGRKLVFANSIDHIRRLHSLFTHLKFESKVLHAHMQQRQRLKNLERFSQSPNCILFCTDVAARGLDIKNVDHVIHYHLPKTYETYVHRSGRTARSGNQGSSLMLMSPNEAKLFVKILNSLNKTESSFKDFPLDLNLLRTLRTRLETAQIIEQVEHRNRRVSKEKSWISGLANDLDLDYEEDENLNDHKLTKELNTMKSRLNQMISSSVNDSSIARIRNPIAYFGSL